MKRVLKINYVKGEYPKYPREDWYYEVRNGDTILGYNEWVKHRIESEEGNYVGNKKS